MQLRASLSAGLSRSAGVDVPPSAIRLPARDFAAGSAAPLRSGVPAPAWAARLNADLSVFPPLFCVCPVSVVSAADGGWLLFTLSDGFYTAALRHVLAAYPPAPEQPDHLYNRLSILARRPSDVCPADPNVQRALFLCMGAGESAGLRRDAEGALETMARRLPPASRQQLLDRCGGVAEAAMRLLYGKRG